MGVGSCYCGGQAIPQYNICNWRSQKASGITQCKLVVSHRGITGVSLKVQMLEDKELYVWRQDTVYPNSRRKWANFLMLHVFVLPRPSMDWMKHAYIGEGRYLLNLLEEILIPLQKHPHSHPEIMFYFISQVEE